MGNQLSQALADAGLVSRTAVVNEAAQERKQDVRRERKKQQKMYLQTDEGRVEHYSSLAELMEHARQRLKDEGYSDGLMDLIFREAHQFADAKLPKSKRGRMHAFLCQVKERLRGLSPSQQKPILRDGRRAFKQMNAKNL